MMEDRMPIITRIKVIDQTPRIVRMKETKPPVLPVINKIRVMMSFQQKEIIVRAMEADKMLFKTKSTSIDARKMYNFKWDRLMRTLNIVQGGARKSVMGWRNSWVALKHKVKVRAMAAKNGGRPLNTLEKRIIRLVVSDPSEKSTICHRETNFTYSDEFEYNMVSFEPPSTSIFKTDVKNPLQEDENSDDNNDAANNDEFETIELQPVDQQHRNDISVNPTIRTTNNNHKTEQAIDAIADLLERQTAAIERQTEAIVRKPTPPTPTSNINAGINVIGQLLERQTKALERQTTVIEKNNKLNLDSDGDKLKVITLLLEKQTAATEKLTEAIEEQTKSMVTFHEMMTGFLTNLSDLMPNKFC